MKTLLTIYVSMALGDLVLLALVCACVGSLLTYAIFRKEIDR